MEKTSKLEKIAGKVAGTVIGASGIALYLRYSKISPYVIAVGITGTIGSMAGSTAADTSGALFAGAISGGLAGNLIIYNNPVTGDYHDAIIGTIGGTILGAIVGGISSSITKKSRKN